MGLAVPLGKFSCQLVGLPESHDINPLRDQKRVSQQAPQHPERDLTRLPRGKVGYCGGSALHRVAKEQHGDSDQL